MIGICALLAMLVILVFGQTIHHDFVNYDDDWYVYENPQVARGLTLAGIGQAFVRMEGGLWTPVVTISHMLDCQLYGLWAGGHHLTNVLLHLASTILLFLILLRMTGAPWRSGFVAALFAIHPLRVESVAWISERKDMLSGLFFMLTLWAYLRYVHRPGSWWRYCATILLFALGLMCKPMLVTLPFVLLLLDYWPLNRLFLPSPAATGFSINWRAVIEKIPLLALSCGLCAATMLKMKATSLMDVEHVPFWTRMGEAPTSFVLYLWQMVWPSRLAVIYTHPEAGLPWCPAALALLALIYGAAFVLRRKRPYLWMGWLWNLGMLAPVSGLVQISRHARADHYNYLPQIGIFVGLTWAAGDLSAHWRHRRVLLATMAAVILSVLSVATWHQTGFWRDSVTLWTHTLGCTQDNTIAHNDLGLALASQGRIEDAIAQYREALRTDPNFWMARNNYGLALASQGRTEDAITQYREALRADPEGWMTRNNLGLALASQGRIEDAIAQYREALRIKPGNAEAHYNLGTALFGERRTEDAIVQFQEALRINPAYAEAHTNLGLALASQGRTEEAIDQFQEALRIKPADADAHYNFGLALASLGRTEDAIDQFRDALRINPADADARNNLGLALIREGKTDEAIAQYREALRMKPGDAEAHYNLGLVLEEQGQTRDAMTEYEAALKANPDSSDALNNLAWLLSTAADRSARDGAKAVQLAERAQKLTKGTKAGILDTLAAAYAQAGDFPNAVRTARKALQLAEAEHNAGLAGALTREIKLYEGGNRYENAP